MKTTMRKIVWSGNEDDDQGNDKKDHGGNESDNKTATKNILR